MHRASRRHIVHKSEPGDPHASFSQSMATAPDGSVRGKCACGPIDSQRQVNMHRYTLTCTRPWPCVRANCLEPIARREWMAIARSMHPRTMQRSRPWTCTYSHCSILSPEKESSGMDASLLFHRFLPPRTTGGQCVCTRTRSPNSAQTPCTHRAPCASWAHASFQGRGADARPRCPNVNHACTGMRTLPLDGMQQLMHVSCAQARNAGARNAARRAVCPQTLGSFGAHM